ncbi:MAG: YggS family pyridoxal phosphate-dependent enzyme [Pirellulales bacterium]
MIGQLQSNKIDRTLPLVALVHALDRTSLGDALNNAAVKAGRTVDVLLEVNISGEASKHGFAPDETPGVLTRADAWRGLRMRGLMGMSGLHSDAAEKRREFAALRTLRDELRRDFPDAALDELSMGMSDDFEIAIEEGATIVRIGSALFE